MKWLLIGAALGATAAWVVLSAITTELPACGQHPPLTRPGGTP